MKAIIVKIKSTHIYIYISIDVMTLCVRLMQLFSAPSRPTLPSELPNESSLPGKGPDYSLTCHIVTRWFFRCKMFPKCQIYVLFMLHGFPPQISHQFLKDE